jgi:endonuclease YncB( thermonuclease family)
VIRLSFLLLMLAMPATAQTVIDGDTIKLNGVNYRLHGIDAPELHQTCPDGWDAGQKARNALQGIIDARGNVRCQKMAEDHYGRTVAICRASGMDMGAAIVSLGYAWAYRKYSSQYVDQEAFAARNWRGLHGHDCRPAWEYRKAEKR